MISDLLRYLAAQFSVAVSFAQDTLPNTDTPPNTPNSIQFFDPLKGMTLMQLLQSILTGLTALAIPVVMIMIIIGAYYLITSGGNPGKRTKGKDYILWACIGFAILLLADSVVAILQDFLK